MIMFPNYAPVNNYYYPNNSYQHLNQLSNMDMHTVHVRYYPDLTEEEFYASVPARNEMLFKQGKLEQLAKYGTFTNCAATYSRVKDNSDFKELINSKYLNSTGGFVRLINNLNSLEIQKQQKFVYPPYATYPKIYNTSVYKHPIPYEKYGMNDYLRVLNDFAKNDKISDDLKKYFLYMKSDKLDLYYTKLENLSNSENPLDVLVESIAYVKE